MKHMCQFFRQFITIMHNSFCIFSFRSITHSFDQSPTVLIVKWLFDPTQPAIYPDTFKILLSLIHLMHSHDIATYITLLYISVYHIRCTNPCPIFQRSGHRDIGCLGLGSPSEGSHRLALATHGALTFGRQNFRKPWLGDP